MEEFSPLFYILLFIIALLYSSVGHGGASGYLALMGIFHFAPEVMKPSALLMNIIVSFIASVHFYQKVKLNKRLFLLLISGSIPAAFIGAKLHLDSDLYQRILGVILLIPAINLFGFIKPVPDRENIPNGALVVAVGIAIGILSGMIGIGGGILLSPLLIFAGWATIKETALISALFICLNSMSGMAGIITSGLTLDPVVYLWIGIALAGGFAGSLLGSRKFSNLHLKRILGIVMLIAGLKLIFH